MNLIFSFMLLHSAFLVKQRKILIILKEGLFLQHFNQLGFLNQLGYSYLDEVQFRKKSQWNTCENIKVVSMEESILEGKIL